ncbi:MAG: LD-carboxypeptidase [Bacillota bacterium]|nr:LD-carboxypeptidase [Bacillota bacterium]
MNKGRHLKKGDTIGLIAPGSSASNEAVKKGADLLKRYGFNLVYGESLNHKRGYLAGSDDIRADDINRMFADDGIDGILCVRGGNGSGRLLDLLDYDLVRKKPKVFVGYSDITVFHIAFSQLANLITFHGPMVATDLGADNSDYSVECFLHAITGSEPIGLLKNPEGERLSRLVGGVTEGPVTGGNLALILSTIGTKYEIDTRGKILFIEDIDEAVYRIDRMLNQLKLANKLQQCAGIVIGEFLDYESNLEDTLTLEEVIQDIIVPLGIPTIKGLKCGHGVHKMTIPIGARARLDSDQCTLSIIENALI